MLKTFRRPAVVAAILLVPIGLAGCGESSEEKATAQVCSSTKEIQAQLSKLASLSISSQAPEEIKTAAEVMQKEATKINESVANLPASSKSQVETASEGAPTNRARSTRENGRLHSKILRECRSGAQRIRARGDGWSGCARGELQAGIQLAQMLLG